MVLVDSSVWILLRSAGFFDLLGDDEPVVCPPVIQEVLQGARSEREYRGLREIFRTTVVLDSPVSLEVYEHAAVIFRTARAAGYTIRSMNDCLIAATAIRNVVPVLHADRDFDNIARVTPLEVRNLAN
ncbi:MAG: PIN domain-containing protein [Acidobacteriota bacterium]